MTNPIRKSKVISLAALVLIVFLVFGCVHGYLQHKKAVANGELQVQCVDYNGYPIANTTVRAGYTRLEIAYIYTTDDEGMFTIRGVEPMYLRKASFSVVGGGVPVQRIRITAGMINSGKVLVLAFDV